MKMEVAGLNALRYCLIEFSEKMQNGAVIKTRVREYKYF